MKSKLDIMLEEIQAYKNLDMNQNVKDRLDKTLELYLENMDKSFSRIRGKRLDIVVKELSRK